MKLCISVCTFLSSITDSQNLVDFLELGILIVSVSSN